MVAVVRRPTLVRSFDDREPLRGVQLVGAQDGANVVVENFGGGARQRAETGVAQPLQITRQRLADAVRAVPNLERREGVDMHARHGIFHRAQQREIGRAVERRMDAALHADFGGAALPGFRGTARDFIEREVVGLAAQIVGGLALGEGAEGAFVFADVGIVDVAVDDVAHGLAADLAPQGVGRVHHFAGFVAARSKQPRDGLDTQPFAGLGPIDNASDVAER